ncbi:MAG: kinase [Alphaproteobacteria bacterium]|nr:kinase [Alphaproteobacteria bacterium]
MITLPIDRRSTATFTQRPSDRALIVHPARKTKALRLARRVLHHLGAPELGTLTIETSLPEGKGLASSSADLVATARAISAALNRPLPLEVLCGFLRELEPTDGVMVPEFVAFLHRKVQLLQRLGLPPRPLRVLAVDEGGEIDTIAYNLRCPDYTAAERAVYQGLLADAVDAFGAGDLDAIGRIATRSATLNQRRNPRRHLATMLRLREDVGALGVAVTHSGPCVGLLFDSAPRHDRAFERAWEVMAGLGLKVDVYATLDPRPAPGLRRPVRYAEVRADLR